MLYYIGNPLDLLFLNSSIFHTLDLDTLKPLISINLYSSSLSLEVSDEYLRYVIFFIPFYLINITNLDLSPYFIEFRIIHGN